VAVSRGLPLAADITGANVPDVKEFLKLVESIPPVRGKPAQPRHRPDLNRHRQEFRSQGIEPMLARQDTAHGSGLGVFCWLLERTRSWLQGFRKQRLVTEKKIDLTTAVIGWRILLTSIC
jgi:hypothetical protein